MPGSAAAIKAPWRMGLAYLYHAYADTLWDLNLPFVRNLDRKQADIVVQMVSKGINAPLTSSLGRLFDGVAAIVGLRQTVAFEGQAAMELEMIADGNAQGSYPYQWTGDALRQVDPSVIIKAIVEDILFGTPAFIISRRFHETMICLWSDLCKQIGDETSLARVVLSGGCFQNVLLLQGLTQALQKQGFNVYSHHLVPTNDGGISLGQAVVAGSRMKVKELKS